VELFMAVKRFTVQAQRQEQFKMSAFDKKNSPFFIHFNE
jgi:hypothetical protein